MAEIRKNWLVFNGSSWDKYLPYTKADVVGTEDLSINGIDVDDVDEALRTLDDEKLNTSGGNLTGDIIFNNTKGIRGKKSGSNTDLNLIRTNNDNTISLGDNNWSRIYFHNSVSPIANSRYQLGEQSLKWGNVYTEYIGDSRNRTGFGFFDELDVSRHLFTPYNLLHVGLDQEENECVQVNYGESSDADTRYFGFTLDDEDGYNIRYRIKLDDSLYNAHEDEDIYTLIFPEPKGSDKTDTLALISDIKALTFTTWNGSTATGVGSFTATSAGEMRFNQDHLTVSAIGSSQDIYIEANISGIKTAIGNASTTNSGLIKTNYTTSGTNYKLNIDSNGNGYVSVPWSDNNTWRKQIWRNAQGGASVTLNNGTDTGDLNVYAGDNVEIIEHPDHSGSVLISATDTTYESKAAASGGTAVSLVTTGEKYNWNAKMNNPMTASGDIIYGGTSGAPTRLAKGSNGKILKLVSGLPSWEDEYSYTLPQATESTLGGVKTYYAKPSSDPTVQSASTTSGRYYGIQVNSDGKMFVNVPWDAGANHYHTPSYSSGLKIATGTGVNDMYVPQASGTAYGVIKVGYTTANKKYKVELDSSGNAFVDVPWENTTYGGDRGISLVNGNFGHSNTQITAQTTQALYPIKIDAYGHITAYGNAVTSLKNPNNLNLRYYDNDLGDVTTISYDGSSTVNYGLDTDYFIGATNTTLAQKIITLKNSGATAGSYGDSSAQTPGYGGTFKVPYITVDAKGRITGISAHNVTIPASDNTDHYSVPLYTTGLDIGEAYGNATEDLYVPIATSSRLGVVKSTTTGTTSGRYYNVEVNSDGTMKVNVPWTDTTYSAEKGISLSNGKFGHSNSQITAQATQGIYPITIDAYGHITGYGSRISTLPNPEAFTFGTYGTGSQAEDYDGYAAMSLKFDVNAFTTEWTDDVDLTVTLNTISTTEIDALFS